MTDVLIMSGTSTLTNAQRLDLPSARVLAAAVIEYPSRYPAQSAAQEQADRLADDEAGWVRLITESDQTGR